MLPNLVVIGAMKCGTTSLHHFLNLHPEIAMSREKELNFFVAGRNWRRGLDWYSRSFADAKVRGESSTNYTKHPRFAGVPGLMHAVIPDAKLIYLVRDPITRIVSHYVHEYAAGRENRDFVAAVGAPDDNEYVACSSYWLQLEQYLRVFPEDAILVIRQEDLRDRRRETLAAVFRFLGVDESFDHPGFSELHHRTEDKRRRHRLGSIVIRAWGLRLVGRLPPEARLWIERVCYPPFSRRLARPTLDDRLRRHLMDRLADDVRRLREHTGLSPAGWCL